MNTFAFVALIIAMLFSASVLKHTGEQVNRVGVRDAFSFAVPVLVFVWVCAACIINF